MKMHDKMIAALDSVAAGNSFAETARRLDITARSIFYWMQRSRNGDEKMIVEWGEWGVAPWHKHCDSAQAMAVALMESEAKSNSTIGFEEVVIFQGTVQYQLDARKVGLDDETCVLLYGDADRYLRNEKGEAIPLTIKRKPSDALVLRMLSSHLKRYAERTVQDVNVNGVLGVMALPRPGDRVEQPKQIEDKSNDFLLEEPVPPEQQPPRIAIGRTAKDSAELAQWEDSGGFIPHQVEIVARDGSSKMIGQEAKQTETSALAAEQPQGSNPDIDKSEDNPLRRSLLDELKKTQAKRAAETAAGKPPQMPPRVPMFKPNDDDNIDDITGQVKPPNPMDDQAIANKVAEVKARHERGEHLNAIEKQILGGNYESLRPWQSADSVGTGNRPPGGFKVV
jgi:transposase-like protein